jgi:hypothetical protein
MKLDYFLKQEKINRIISYAEQKEGNKIFFGWKEVKNISLNTKLVVSKTKKETNTNIDVATIKDYISYFRASTGETPESFLEKWSKDKTGLSQFLKENKQEKYLPSEEVFWIKMAELLSQDKSFSKYGISYKIIDLE